MKTVNAKRNFLIEAIKGLSKENFDELVRIFQSSYWQNEIVYVDGARDGGTDIKVFKNKKEQNKCIQITVQKQGLETKIYSDLRKVSEKISKYGYSNRFEFYCSSSVSEEIIEKVKKNALQEYDIVIEIFDAKRIAQLNCKEVSEYVYGLHDDIVVKPQQMTIDRATKTLYDLLANGKDSSDIKNSLVNSVIISIIYEKGPIGIVALKDELENRLGKEFPDISHSINTLKSEQRIIKAPENPELLILSDLEYSNVKEILVNATKLEKEFCESFAKILDRYQISYTQEILDELKSLYKYHYNNDINDNIPTDDSAYLKVFESFKRYLVNLIDDKDNIDLLIEEIKNLCLDNSYLNKISASESFLSLYKSNQLEQYINQRHKDIYLDTPAFVYLLCDYYVIEKNDWDNPFYRSMKNLIRLRNSYPDKISLSITRDYLGEVAGEIKKALQFSQFENFPFFEHMGGTRNTLFNYYVYLKEKELFEETDGIEKFDDFIYSLGFDNVNPNSIGFFKDTLMVLEQVAENLNIRVVDRSLNEKYTEFKTIYEGILLVKRKEKSDTAICNDVNQVLILLEQGKDTDCYFTTWDTTIYLLRDKIRSANMYGYFNICNPAKLSNKIALENFNIDESALTNDIFAYAEKRYDISSRVKGLLELISPFLRANETGSRKLLRHLGRIRKEQIELSDSDIEIEGRKEKNLPIEEIIMLLIPNKEKAKEDKDIMNKFSVFMSSEENTDYIIDVINQISELKDYRMYDLTEYFEKLESVNLSIDKE